MPKKPNTPIDFEQSLNQLTNLVEKMEQGNLSLEESLQYYEKGVGLIRECQQALTKAKTKVQRLAKENYEEVLKPFYDDSDE